MIYCPSCGAELRFDIDSQLMICEYCKSSFDAKSLKDKISDDAKTQEYYESYAYVCPSCGAEVDTTDKNDAVGFCPYCGGSSMIFDKLRKEWCPEGIIPFRITKEQCKELYCKEVKKHIFVSKKYRDPELIDNFRGIYMPYVSFTGNIDGEEKKIPALHLWCKQESSYVSVIFCSGFAAVRLLPVTASGEFRITKLQGHMIDTIRSRNLRMQHETDYLQ